MESAESTAWEQRPPCPDCGRLPAIITGGAAEWDTNGRRVTKTADEETT